MIDISKFLIGHIPLCVCTLGVAILGYMGYRAVRWIINKCCKTQKIDRVARNIISSCWDKVINTEEFDKYKKNWRSLARSAAVRKKEALRLRSSYETIQHVDLRNAISPGSDHSLGYIEGVPGEFSLWMPGVALVAAYLAEKKKVEGLYVCKTLEAFRTRINEISLSPSNQRCAFVVGTTRPHSQQNYPQHKVTVCVEKKEGQLTIALLDAQPAPECRNKEISPKNLSEELWGGNFNSQELVFRAILSACRSSQCQARLLHSQVLRQKSYGCEVFALQGAIAYLQDPNFFDRITCSQEATVKVDEHYSIEVITTLPSEYMVGAQSSGILEDFRKKGGQFDEVLPGKNKTLQNYLDAHSVYVWTKTQNHYITKQSFKYLNLVMLALKNLNKAEIEQLVSKTLIK